MKIPKEYRLFGIVNGSRLGVAGLLLFWLLFPFAALRAELRTVVDIGFSGDLYFVRESANNGQAFANILLESTVDNHRIYVDVGAGGLIGKSGHTFVKAPELYYQIGREGRTSLYLGRWKTTWSFVDDNFHLGITQPMFVWDGARPESQGLTGIFFDAPEVGIFRLTLFASPITLPSQAATFQFVDGKIISSNPWFAPPVEAVSFAGEVFALNYSLDAPSLGRLVFQPSAGLRIAANEQERGLFTSGFFLDKPSHDLVLPFEGLLNLTTFQGDIVVRPRQVRHQVGGADIGYRLRAAEFSLSWVYDGGYRYIEEPSLISPPVTYPELPDQNIFGGGVKVKATRQHDIMLTYMNAVREPTAVRGVYSGNDVNVFETRNRFEDALTLAWLGKFLQKDGVATFNSRLGYTYDTEDSGSWISGSLSWWLTPGIEITGQCDFFGSSKREIAGGDFIDRFQNNDRCLMGGLYAF